MRLALLLTVSAALLPQVNVNGQCTGQCDSLIQAVGTTTGLSAAYLQADTTFNNEQVPTTSFGPSFRFEYESDSSHLCLRVSEFGLNRHQLYLSNWCNNQTINFDSYNEVPIANWTQTELNNRSTTTFFKVQAGDTVSFFKELWFFRLGTSGAVHAYYKNSSVLSYSIELVDSASRVRLLLLDTCRFDTTRVSRRPCIFSWYPMYARVRAVVPSLLGGSTVFLRCNTYATGNGALPWVRNDAMTMNLSNRLLSLPGILDYCDSVEVNIECSTTQACEFTVGTTQSPSGLSITVTPQNTLDAISVVGLDGEVYWSANLPLQSNPSTLPLNHGLYVVVGLKNGQVLCTKKVTVY